MVAPVMIPEGIPVYSLEDWLANPPVGTEWVDGELVEKSDMTLRHSEVQANLSFYWRNHKDRSGQAGKVYTEAPCRTNKQGRSPDVAYLTPDLVAQ